MLQCLTYSKNSAQHLVEMGAVLPITQQLTAGQENLVQNQRQLGDKVGGTDQGLADVVRMVDAAIGILANVAFYAPRKPPAAVLISKSTLAVKAGHGKVTSVRNPHTVYHEDSKDAGPAGPKEIVAQGAVAVLVVLMTPKAVGERGSKRYALLAGVVESAASALRNLAYHEDCVGAISAAGAIAVITRYYQAAAHPDDEIQGREYTSNPTAGCL